MRAQNRVIPSRFARQAAPAKSSSLPEKAAPALVAAMLIMLMGIACGGGAHSIPHQPTPLALSSIYVAPVSIPSIRVGSTLRFTVVASYSDPSGVLSNRDVTSSATWTTSDASIATVEKGLATGTGMGSVIITATFEGKSDSRKMVVSLEPISIVIAPTDTKMFSLSAKGATFSAIATYPDGTTLDLSESATWTSKPSGILTFYPYFPGEATFLKTGTTTITATFDTGEAPTKEITVVP